MPKITFTMDITDDQNTDITIATPSMDSNLRVLFVGGASLLIMTKAQAEKLGPEYSEKLPCEIATPDGLLFTTRCSIDEFLKFLLARNSFDFSFKKEFKIDESLRSSSKSVISVKLEDSSDGMPF